MLVAIASFLFSCNSRNTGDESSQRETNTVFSDTVSTSQEEINDTLSLEEANKIWEEIPWRDPDILNIVGREVWSEIYSHNYSEKTLPKPFVLDVEDARLDLFLKVSQIANNNNYRDWSERIQLIDSYKKYIDTKELMQAIAASRNLPVIGFSTPSVNTFYYGGVKEDLRALLTDEQFVKICTELKKQDLRVKKKNPFDNSDDMSQF